MICDLQEDRTTYWLGEERETLIFSVDRHGRGRCCRWGEVVFHLNREYPDNARNAPDGGAHARQRLNDLENEFWYEVTLPTFLNAELWAIWLALKKPDEHPMPDAGRIGQVHVGLNVTAGLMGYLNDL